MNKKLLLTSGFMAMVAGSQIGYAACVDSGAPGASASCTSDVTLSVADLVVLKGLDDYDFTGAPGWDGTAGGSSSVAGDVCIGTNNIANGVDVTITSASGDFSVTGSSGGPLSYTVELNSSAVTHGTPIDVTGGALLDNLVCANENFDLDVAFAGTELLAAVGGVTYTDTVTVLVAPN